MAKICIPDLGKIGSAAAIRNGIYVDSGFHTTTIASPGSWGTGKISKCQADAIYYVYDWKPQPSVLLLKYSNKIWVNFLVVENI